MDTANNREKETQQLNAEGISPSTGVEDRQATSDITSATKDKEVALIQGKKAMISLQPSSSWRVVEEAAEEFRFMRLREKRLFFCQLSATLDTELQEIIRGILLPFQAAYTTALLAGPVSNIFSRDLQPCVDGEEQAASSTQHKHYTDASGSKTACDVSHQNLTAGRPSATVTGSRRIVGPLAYQRHRHIASDDGGSEVGHRGGERQKADSVTSSVSGMTPFIIPQRQHAPQQESHRKMLDDCTTRGLVSFRIEKLSDPSHTTALKKLKRKGVKSRKLAKETAEERQDRALRYNLLAKFRQMDSTGKVALVGNIFRDDPYSQENIELGSFFNDCIRQRILDRPSISKLSDDLLKSVLYVLPAHDICRAAEVCKRWRTLLSVDDLWRKKCLELGKSNGLQNLPNDIVASVAPPIQWKRQFHHWHRKFKDRGRKQAEAAKSKLLEGQKRSMVAKFRAAGRRLGTSAAIMSQKLLASKVRIATGLADEDAIMDLDAEELESLVKSSLQEMEMWLGEEKALRKMEQEELRSRFGQKINAILDARAAAEAADASDLVAGGGGGAGRKELRKDGSTLKLVALPCYGFDVRMQENAPPTIDDNLFFHLAIPPPTQFATPLSSQKEWQLENRLVDCGAVQTVRQLEASSGLGILSMCTDRRRIICGCGDSAVRIWSICSGQPVTTLKAHKGSVHCVGYHGDLIASGSFDTTCIIWNALNQEEVAVLQGHKETVTCLAMNKNFVITGSKDESLRMWSATSWTTLVKFQGHTGPVNDLVLRCTHDYPHQLFSASSDGSVLLWDLTGLLESNGAIRQSFSNIECLGPSCKLVDSNTCLLKLSVPVTCIGVAHNLLVAGDKTGAGTLCDMGNCRKVAQIAAHKGAVRSLDIAGEFLMTGGMDMLIKQWSLKTGQCIRVLAGHIKPVHGLKVVEPHVILSASEDCTVRVWQGESPYVEEEEEEDQSSVLEDFLADEPPPAKSEEEFEWAEFLTEKKAKKPREASQTSKKNVGLRSSYLEELARERQQDKELKQRREELRKEGKLPVKRKPKPKTRPVRTYLTGGRNIPAVLLSVLDFATAPELQPEAIKKCAELL